MAKDPVYEMAGPVSGPSRKKFYIIGGAAAVVVAATVTGFVLAGSNKPSTPAVSVNNTVATATAAENTKSNEALVPKDTTAQVAAPAAPDSNASTAIADAKPVKVVNEKIYFDTASFNPNAAELMKLDAVESLIKGAKSAQIFIVGHTDAQGTDENNLKLSQKRAEQVKTMLQTAVGTNDKVVYTTQFYGKSKSAADNQSPEGRAQNRRVEIRVEIQ